MEFTLPLLTNAGGEDLLGRKAVFFRHCGLTRREYADFRVSAEL